MAIFKHTLRTSIHYRYLGFWTLVAKKVQLRGQATQYQAEIDTQASSTKYQNRNYYLQQHRTFGPETLSVRSRQRFSTHSLSKKGKTVHQV